MHNSEFSMCTFISNNPFNILYFFGWNAPTHSRHSLRACVFGDSFGPLRHGVFGEFSGQQESDCGLHLSAGDGGALVILCQPRSLCSDALEHIINKWIHDAHCPAGDASVWMNLQTKHGTFSEVTKQLKLFFTLGINWLDIIYC